MNVARNLLQGAAGGLLAGSLVGLAEASWGLVARGTPDLWSPIYAWVLYGVFFGLPLGVAAGAGVTGLERFLAVTEERAFAIGASGAFGPMGLLVAAHVASRHTEQGLGGGASFALIAVVVAAVALLLLVAPILLRGPAKPLLKGPGALGAWGAVAVVGLAAAWAQPGDDPRERWAHGKPLPDELSGKPNVLVIMVDTLRADHLGAYGGSVPTPTLDALASDGIVFEKAYAQSSWTRASAASLMTSRLPSGHGAALEASRLPDGVHTWAEQLRDSGVVTGAIVDNFNVTRTFGFDQGFDTFLHEAPEYRFGATESVFGLSLYRLVDRLAGAGEREVGRSYQPAGVVLADALGFVGANAASRWSLFVHLMEPHDPYFEHAVVDGGDPDPARLKELYAGEIAFLDRQLAPFVGELKAKGLYDDLLVIVTSDHGEELGEHGGFWHGSTLHDEQIHVPLIVKLPRQRLAGVRVPWQVRSVDVAPTITAAVGVPAGEGWTGSDLIAGVDAWLADRAEQARLAEEAAAAAAEATPTGGSDQGAASEAMEAEGGAEEPPIALPAPEPPPDPCAVDPWERPAVAELDLDGNRLLSIRKGGFKLVTANEGNPRGLPPVALYDVLSDPAERENLATAAQTRCGDAGPARAEALAAELTAILAHAKAGATAAETATMTAADCEKLQALGHLGSPCNR
jgi:arylsulfatase A-like enzyme